MKVILQYLSIVIIVGNFLGGALHDIDIIFEFQGIVSVICLVHFGIFIGLVVIWSKKICPHYYETTKAPLYLVSLAWYASLPLFIFQTELLERLGYGHVTDSFYTDSPMFYILFTSSFFILWYWEDIQKYVPQEFCTCRSAEDHS